MYDYVFLHLTLENSIMTNLAFASLIRICNMTDYSIADILEIKEPKNGVLNEFISESFLEYQTLTDYMNKDPQKYRSFENDVEYTCENIFYSFEDSFVKEVLTKYNSDLRPISINICLKHKLLNSPSFSYLRTDLLNRILILNNKHKEKDYNSNYAFMTCNEFYELITITMFIFRPLSSILRNQVLLPTIDNTFSFYVVLVGLYLCINMILESLLVIIVKFFISRQLNQIQKNLYLLNNCLN